MAHNQKLAEIYSEVFGVAVECWDISPDAPNAIAMAWELSDGSKVNLDLMFLDHEEFPGASLAIFPQALNGDGLGCTSDGEVYWCDEDIIPSDRRQWERFAELVWSYFFALPTIELGRLYCIAEDASKGRMAVADKYYAANPELIRCYPNPINYATEEVWLQDCTKYLKQRGILKTRGD